jgi:hypothetical protein
MVVDFEIRINRKVSISLVLIILILLFAFVLVVDKFFPTAAYEAPSPPQNPQIVTAILLSALSWFWSLIASAPRYLNDLFSWQIVALTVFLIVFLVGNKEFIRVFSRAKKFRLSEFEVELSEEGARTLNMSAKHAFADYKAQADTEFERQVRLKGVRHLLELTLRETTITTSDSCKPILDHSAARCTIHVQDILFEDNLLQLIDYYPAGDGAMRRFSIRYGALGRAWRLATHFEKGEATKISQHELIELWGMTSEESQKISRHRPSYLRRS